MHGKISYAAEKYYKNVHGLFITLFDAIVSAYDPNSPLDSPWRKNGWEETGGTAMDISGKTSVITGGATGIGFALARELGKRGSRIVLFEPRQERLEEAVQNLREEGIDTKYSVGDVTEIADLEALADFVWRENGRADLLVANAGVGGERAKGLDADLDLARSLYEVNFWGVWASIQVFGRRWMKEEQSASAYAVASENALFNAFPFAGGAYVASKHAVLGLMETLRRDVPDWLTLGVILPGWVRSEISEVNKTVPAAMDTDEYARIIAPQIAAGEYYVVSHGYNMVRFDERYDELRAAFEKYAPRTEGDDQHDVQKFFAKMQAREKD